MPRRFFSPPKQCECILNNVFQVMGSKLFKALKPKKYLDFLELRNENSDLKMDLDKHSLSNSKTPFMFLLDSK